MHIFLCAHSSEGDGNGYGADPPKHHQQIQKVMHTFVCEHNSEGDSEDTEKTPNHHHPKSDVCIYLSVNTIQEIQMDME